MSFQNQDIRPPSASFARAHGRAYSSGIPTKTKKKMTPQGQNKTPSMPQSSSTVPKPRHVAFPTDYRGLIRQLPSGLPSSLMRVTSNGDDESKRKENPGVGKVKIMLCVASDRTMAQESAQEFLRVEGDKKHVSVFVPSDPEARNKALAPKVYAFDSVFTENTSQEEICLASLVDVIQAVLQGADGTVFCYGQSNLGKTFVLFGDDRSPPDVGIVPCAIKWLYRCLDDIKRKRRTRLFVRVSAIEVYGRSEKLRDLLAGYCEDRPASPLCIKEDPLMGTQLQNQSEIGAETAEKAAFLLDAALACRSCTRMKNSAESRRHSHMVFTLHVYRHQLDKTVESGVVGGRSRLHFIDLGSCEKTLVKTTNSLALSHSSLGHVIMSIVNNSKHVPFKESKLTRILREHLGNINCRAVMLAHVSRNVIHYSDALSTIQMASRIHRVLKKRNKMTCEGNYKVSDQRFNRAKPSRSRFRDDESLGSSSGLEYTSGSELSCDTVVYVNKQGVPVSDRELTDNEGPPEYCHSPASRMFQMLPGKSPPDEVGMVYNVARAKVEKVCSSNLASEMTSSSHAMQRDAMRRDARRSSGESENIDSIVRDRKVGNNYENISNFSNSKASKPTPDCRSCNQTTAPFFQNKVLSKGSKSLSFEHRVNDISKPLESLSNAVYRQRSGAMLDQQHQDEQVERCVQSKPVKPPRHGKGGKDRDSAGSASEKSSKISSRQSSLPRPLKPSNSSTPRVCKKAKNLNKVTEVSKKSLNSEIGEKELAKSRALINHPQPQGERPEPVGSDFKSISNGQIALADRKDKVPIGLTNCTPTARTNRPDSMVVNVDDSDDWCLLDNDRDDVDVNFYCLTFATRNPLLPLTKRKFAQQITSNFKRKSPPETDGDGRSRVGARHVRKLEKAEAQCEKLTRKANPNPPEEDNQTNDLERSKDYLHLKSKVADEGDGLQSTENTQNDLNVKTEVALPEIISEVNRTYDDEDHPEELQVTEMAKLSCDYGENTAANIDRSTASDTLKSEHLRNNQISSVVSTQEVCLYNSNTLAISYVNTKQGSGFAKEQNASSPSVGRREPHVTDSDALMRNRSHVMMTKSTLKEGARLTLVKKHRTGGPSTLELLITNEDDHNNNNGLAASKERAIGDLSSSSRSDSRAFNSPSFTSPKKSKWFGGKKKAEKTTLQPENAQKIKSSRISRLLSGKAKSNARNNSNNRDSRENRIRSFEGGRHPAPDTHAASQLKLKPPPSSSKSKYGVQNRAIATQQTCSSLQQDSSSSRFGFSRKFKKS